MVKPGCYAVIFTSTLHNSEADGYATAADRMMELAADQPGFLGVDSVRNGTHGITVSYWRGLDDIAAWKHQAEHLDAQRRGRDQWYARFDLHICRVKRSETFSTDENGRAGQPGG